MHNDRLERIVSYSEEFGVDEASDKFGLAVTTIKRYRRKAREEGIVTKTYSNPKILLFDIETSPMEFYGWRTGKQYVSENNIIENSAILTWSGKWLMDDEIFTHQVSVPEAVNREDMSVVRELHKIFDDADILIAHNCDRFDKTKANTRFIMNGFSPPSSYQTVDTLKVARKNFNFPSNKLDYLSKLLIGDEKLDTSFSLWKRCVTGDKSALDEMLEYNKHDVEILEEVYLELRPWIKSHPNLGLYYDDLQERCPNCGGANLIEKGHYYTAAGRYQSKRCEDCGAYGRDRCHDLSQEKRASLKRPLAH